MTDCGCEKAKHDLEEYLHNELDRVEYADITEHMHNCVDCTEELHVGVVLTDAVRRACKDTAPEELREQVVLRLRVIAGH
jgi:anti-sigma factor (TIGR02949 family)